MLQLRGVICMPLGAADHITVHYCAYVAPLPETQSGEGNGDADQEVRCID
jgi:hypothetical protein